MSVFMAVTKAKLAVIEIVSTGNAATQERKLFVK